jgi:peptidoglycan/xylan/chitin deacetylase (PgdA/CDA1 family)
VSEKTFTLGYHDVSGLSERDAVGFPGPMAALYKLQPEHFSAHLDAIAASPVAPALADGASRAILTFDDGGASNAWIAAELERRGWRGAFFIVTEKIGAPGFLGAEQIRALAERGHEVGSHSHTHPTRMAALGARELQQEWQRSRELLAELLGSPPRSAAVPGGSLSQAVIAQAAAAGYERLFTSNPRARAVRHEHLRVLGRYTIWAADAPELAAKLIGGAPAPRARRWIAWEARSAARRLSPRAYGAVRAYAARRRTDSSRKSASRAL